MSRTDLGAPQRASGGGAPARPAAAADRAPMRGWRPASVLLLFASLLLAVAVASVGLGAVPISPAQTIAILADRIGLELGTDYSGQQASVLWAIRLPRVALGALVGAGLGAAGAALQGMFRNPLADPGLIGVSSGAAVGAIALLVVGVAPLGLFSVPVAAFAGGVAATVVVYACARYQGRSETVTLLLCGIAVNTLAGAIIGLILLTADDDELRSVVFWSLGSLGGATWTTVLATAPPVLAAVLLLPLIAKSLDLLVLGEREAGQLGVATERTRIVVIVLAALATGASVAAAGIVGFVGLVVPHIVRLLAGPGHRIVVPGSALLGAALLLAADLAARTIAAPAEIPLGTVTALVGGPFFLALVVRTRRRSGGWG